MDELNASSFEPGYFILPYGVPVSANCQKVNAIFGTLAWSFDDDEIVRMLSGGLLLDGISAGILSKRGFKQYIGVDFKGLIDREKGKYSIETVVSRKTGVKEGLSLNTNLLVRLSMLEPRKGASEWTTIITPERKRFGGGIIVCKNKLGGRVATFAAPNPACLPSSYQRQTITQNVIRFISGGKFTSIMVTGGANLLPIHFESEDKHFAVVLNGSPDAARPIVRVNGIKDKPAHATLLTPLGMPVKAKVNIVCEKNAVYVTSRSELPYLGFLVLQW